MNRTTAAWTTAALLTTPVLAQSLDFDRDWDERDRAVVTPAPAADPNEAPLAGPSVDTHIPPGMLNGMALTPRGAGNAIPDHLLRRALMRLRSDEVPVGFHLTPGQNDEIDRIIERNEQAKRDYDKEQAKQMRDLRKQLNNAREFIKQFHANAASDASTDGDGKPTPIKPIPAETIDMIDAMAANPGMMVGEGMNAPDAMSAPDAMTAMSPVSRLTAAETLVGQTETRIREIRSARPGNEEVVRQIWAILSDSQRDLAERFIADEVQEQEDQRIANMVQRQRQQRESDRMTQLRELAGIDETDEETDAMEVIQGFDLSSVPPRIRERLEQMSPDQRAAAIARLRRANLQRTTATDTAPAEEAPARPMANPREDRPTDAQRRTATRRNRTGQKPPPTIDEVAIPLPAPAEKETDEASEAPAESPSDQPG